MKRRDEVIKSKESWKRYEKLQERQGTPKQVQKSELENLEEEEGTEHW